MDYPKFFHDNRFADAAPVASSTAAGDFDPANLADFYGWTWWKPGAMPGTVRVDCSASKAADSCFVWGHDLGSQGATFNVRRSPLGTWSGADDVLVATKTPADDKPFLLEFASVSSQHWGIEVTGAAAPSLAIAAIGAALEVPAGLRERFDPVGRRAVGRSMRTVTGNPLPGIVDYRGWGESLTFELLSWAWLRDTWLPAWEAHLESEPFGFAWAPATYPGELFLVRHAGDFKGPHRAGSVGDLSLDIEGLPA